MFFRRPTHQRNFTVIAAAALASAALHTPIAAAAPKPTDTPKPANPTPPAEPGSTTQEFTSASALPRMGGKQYTVAAGDTISHLALRFGVSQAQLVAANQLNSRHHIRAGEVLTIPVAGSTTRATTKASPKGASPTGAYLVKAGDSLSTIAAASGVTLKDLRAANPSINGDVIRPGMKIVLPTSKRRPGTTPAAKKSNVPQGAQAGGTYRVKAGDTMSSVAAAAGISVRQLRGINPHIEADLITVGDVLSIPSTARTDKKTRKVGNSFAGRTYSNAVVSAAQRNLDTLATRKLPSKAAMQDIIRATAIQHGVDPALALAIAKQESGFDMRQVSPANAIGAMQVIPSSGKWASQMAGRSLDLLDPHDNATAGVLVLKANLRSAANMDQGIGGYYQGLGSIRRRGMYADTRRYVANVRTLSTRFR